MECHAPKQVSFCHNTVCHRAFSLLSPTARLTLVKMLVSMLEISIQTWSKAVPSLGSDVAANKHFVVLLDGRGSRFFHPRFYPCYPRLRPPRYRMPPRQLARPPRIWDCGCQGCVPIPAHCHVDAGWVIRRRTATQLP